MILCLLFVHLLFLTYFYKLIYFNDELNLNCVYKLYVLLILSLLQY